jgi:hypothetical protein
VPGKFGLFEADLDQGALSRPGARRVQEQPFRILALLPEAL